MQEREGTRGTVTNCHNESPSLRNNFPFGGPWDQSEKSSHLEIDARVCPHVPVCAWTNAFHAEGTVIKRPTTRASGPESLFVLL